MLTRFSPAISAGLVFGLLFFAHAAVPFSRAWPLLWPLLAGAAAVYLATRRSSQAGPIRHSIGLGAGAGVIAGVVFYLGTVALLYLLTLPGVEPLARTLGAEGALTAPSAVMLLTLAGVGVFGGLFCGALGSILAHPLLRQRHA